MTFRMCPCRNFRNIYGEIQTHLKKLSLFNIDGQQEIRFKTAASVWIKATHVRTFTTLNQNGGIRVESGPAR